MFRHATIIGFLALFLFACTRCGHRGDVPQANVAPTDVGQTAPQDAHVGSRGDTTPAESPVKGLDRAHYASPPLGQNHAEADAGVSAKTDDAAPLRRESAPAGRALPTGALAGGTALQPRAKAAEAAPPPASYSMNGASVAEPTPAPAPERPGLGTEWGEARYSAVHDVEFARSSTRPQFTATLWYNDNEGVRAMSGRYASGQATMMLGGAISVSLRDENGHVLPAAYAGGRTYAIGEAGRRYTLVIENHTGARFEIVASVDGLDVLDGRSASFTKSGYLLSEYGVLEIDGFRQSSDQVAAFRFGSVRNSYAARTGSDRNVGVIGVAAFVERGARWWSSREITRREAADPFPSRYASPPQTRW